MSSLIIPPKNKLIQKWSAPKKTETIHYAVADNILNRQFETESANQVWVSDITYIKVQQNGLYLAIIIDLYCLSRF